MFFKMILNEIIAIILLDVSLVLICQKVEGGEISSLQSFDAASINENSPSINEPSIDENYHDINAVSINEDYNNLDSFRPLNDQIEEKRPIDITKKLKDLGNKITSFFIGDSNYEESSNTEATLNRRNENKSTMKFEDSLGDKRGFAQEHLSELSKKLEAHDGNVGDRTVDKKIGNEAETRRGNEKFENNRIHVVPPGKVDSELLLQDAYINAMPLLKQYLKIFSKMEPQNNFYRSSLNPPPAPQNLPGLKRIQGYLKSANSQLRNGSLPGFRGDPLFLDRLGKKLKGFRYNTGF